MLEGLQGLLSLAYNRPMCSTPAEPDGHRSGRTELGHIDAKIADLLRKATRVVVLTGAGISAESGVPTFRDKQTGLWEKYEASDLATPSAFRRDPPLVWGWYEWRRMTVLRAQPNAAHRAIAAMAERVPGVTLVTQNVDDLHERAGSRQVVHLHGEIGRPYCEACSHPYPPSLTVPAIPEGGCRIEPPQCTVCGGRIRPGVVWFGESLPDVEWLAAWDAARQCEVFLCVGTSALVQPAASLTTIASRAGAVTVQVNPNPTALDSAVSFTIRGLAGEVLPRLVRQAWGADSGLPPSGA
jgi:NAD-dependent deacetylase